MTGIVIAARCHYCSRYLPPSRVHALGPAENPAQTICDDCLLWHARAIELMAGQGVPPGCQKCGTTREILAMKAPGIEYKLYVVPKDGVLQVLCGECVVPYVGQRRDLYGKTPFGERMKL